MSVLAVIFSFLCLLIIGCISQAPPDGICGPDKVYTQLENNITIIAMTNITGEPFNITYWGDPMNINYFNLSSEGRYEQLQLGQLKITNVTDSDIGEWVFGVANKNGYKSCSVNLARATRPGAPRDVIVSDHDVTSTTAILSWTAPVNKGDPPLTHYKVKLTPAPPPDVALTTVDNTTSFTLSGLVPSTLYIVTVAGVSVQYPHGDPSVSANFTTKSGPPDIKNVSAQPDNDGNIEVKWTLRHTGGVDPDLVTINIFCRRPGDLMTYTMMSSGSGSGMPRAPGSTDELSGTCEGNMDTCLSNDTLMGNLKVGIVYAGEMYRCGVDVSTMAGSDFQNVSKVISQIGKPSRPIVSAVAQPGGIKLTLQSQYAGVPSSDDSFEFQIVAINLETRQKINFTYPYSNYVNNQMVERMLSLPIGEYNITVNAFNKYGSSEVWRVGPVNVTMSYSPSSTLTPPFPTTNPTSPTSPTYLPAIAGGVIGGVILLVVVVVVIAVFTIVNKKKKKGIIKVTPQLSEKTKSQPI